MRIKDLGNLFPSNQVLAQSYHMDTAEEIQREYNIIEAEVSRLKLAEENSASILAKITYARMRIEQLKIPTLLELIREYLAENAAVAVFVNFTNTLQTISEELKTKCIIYGQQSLEEREVNINNFKNDRSRIIICNIRSGGVGISLHDTIGNFPRVSIISPSWSAQDIIQALGRIHRANGKTPVRQRIVYCQGTIEQQICNKLIEKIQYIAELNDGDINGESYHIPGLTDGNEINIVPASPNEIKEKKIQVAKERCERLKKELEEANIYLNSLMRGEDPSERTIGKDSNQ